MSEETDKKENTPLYPIPIAKQQVKFYNENKHIERPQTTLANLLSKKALTKQNCDVLLSLILQRLVGGDPDRLSSSSDVRLQIGEKPTYYIKSEGGWVRDERMPVIEDYMMKFFFDYVIPEINKTNIVEKKSKLIYSVDEDFSIDLNINKNFDYNKVEKTEHGYQNMYSTKPQYVVDNGGTPDINLSRFRGNLTRARGEHVIILRKIDAEIPDFFEYKLNPRFLDFIKYERGLILITGPTGSGKSVTMAAIINEINKTQKKHIVTLENPIEFVHTNKQSFFTQRDIPADSASFSAGMKSALRQKPDIIIFGEMRDEETISGAIEAAETGHLVFGTLHTFNAAKTIDRLINSFPEESHSQVAASLSGAFVGVISQMLIKTRKGGITALNEMVTGTEGVKHAIGEMKSDMITASASNDPSKHLTMVNHAFELIKSDMVEPNELFRKIYVEDVDTYKTLVQKLKADTIYDEKNDMFTEVNQKKEKLRIEKEIEDKMGITKKEVVKTNLSEAGSIEKTLNNEKVDKKNEKVNKKSRLLI